MTLERKTPKKIYSKTKLGDALTIELIAKPKFGPPHIIIYQDDGAVLIWSWQDALDLAYKLQSYAAGLSKATSERE
jgi:hypothetical protein